MLGYVLVGAVTGLLAATATVLAGSPFWVAMLVYTVTATAVMFLVPLVQFAIDDRLAGGAVPGAPPLSARRAGSMSILAVDDDAFILELLPKITAKTGFADVTGADGAAAALSLLERRDEPFDCLMLDISMPGMDGIELCRRIRAMPAYSKTPIIMLTAMRDIGNIGSAIVAGATDYATKPFDIEDLRARLEHAWDLVQASRSAPRADPVADPVREAPPRVDDRWLENLISAKNLASYLSLLPNREIEKVSVFAIWGERRNAASDARDDQGHLRDVAVAAARCFEAQRPLMAIVDGSAIMVAADASTLLSVETVEQKLQRLLAEMGADINVSVGGAVHPVGARSGRAEVAFTKAVSLATDRARHKSGSSDRSKVVRLIR